MLFNSFEFLLIFLPLTLWGYFLVARMTRAPIYSLFFLAAASLAFYAYWDPHFLPIIICSIGVNYLFGLLLGRSGLSQQYRKLLFIVAIVSNLLALGFYKYINFGLQIWSSVSGHQHDALSIVLPLGISFFSFTQIAYLADVYSGHPQERNFIKYVLFVTYFPHLIAGPILHHKEMMPQFGAACSRRFSADKIALGLTVLAVGLFKKTVVADGFAHIADPVFNSIGHNIVTMSDAWGAALAYALQIYFDFSAYSDMAIGISLMFGIKLPFNFDAPYKSRNIIEFWRRWHITLSRFLRDYVYIALGGNQRGKVRRYLNLLLTMLLGGLWHGAGWTYIAWGYLHGCYLVVNHLWRKVLQIHPWFTRLANTLPYATLSLLLTQLAVVIAWVYFRADTLRDAHRMLAMMFHVHAYRLDSNVASTIVTNLHLGLIAFAYLCCLILPNIKSIFEKYDPALKTYDNQQTWSLLAIEWRPNAIWAGLTALLILISMFSILVLGIGSQFLYFQF